MNVSVLAFDGSEKGQVNLDERVFGGTVNQGLIYYAIQSELANCRVGTARTKTRGEVRASGKKPWRQKGTGRARAGTRRSPIWTGGGTTFGPQPRDYSQRMPRQQKRQAMLSLLSLKMKEDELRVVQDFTVSSGKTKDLLQLLQKVIVPHKRSVLILSDEKQDLLVKQAARNISWLSYLSYSRLRAHDLFYGRQIVFTETVANKLNQFYIPNGDTPQ